MKTPTTVLAVIAAASLSCALGVGLGTVIAGPNADVVTVADQPANLGTPAGTAATKVAPAKTQAPTITDGVWTVGVDIPAGHYRTTAAVGSRCYWQISKAGGDSVTDIIDNDLPGGGRPSVTLKKGQDFKTSDCGKWRKA